MGEEDLLKVSEVARRLRVDKTTVRRWIQQGSLEAVILPGKKNNLYRVKKSTLERILEEGA